MANKNTKAKKYIPVANPQYAAAMHDLRSSGAAGSHDNRPNRQRTRSAAKKASIQHNSW